ncbi:alkaline phosphatase family protein [Myroides sp. LJL116]
MTKAFYLMCTLLFFTSVVKAQNHEKEHQIVIENRFNASEQVDKPYVIMISIDGFRYDYIKKHDAKFLAQLAQKGVEAESLIPSFPSVTFPNHYTLVTGLYPANHGLTGNNIYDQSIDERYSLRNGKQVRNPQWYGGTPLWVLAEKAGLLSACYYWPGSEAAIQNTLPTYYYAYSEKSDIEDRIQAVEQWLSLPEQTRPHFITFYLPQVDHAGHGFGPDAKQTYEAVQYVDKALEQLVTRVNKTGLPINFVIVSDHGMLDIDQETLLSFPIKADEEQLTLVSNGTLMSVFVKNKQDIDLWYNKIQEGLNKDHMTVYKNEDLPKHLNFGAGTDKFDRVGDIVLLAKAPYYFTNRAFPASHGYDPKQIKEMDGIFIGQGPNFKENHKVESFKNVDVYPIVARILNLPITQEIDGEDKIADKVLLN